MRSIEFFIPGAPPSPNARESTTRGRMVSVGAQRDKAYACAVAARNEKGVKPFTGPARIRLEVHRWRLLDNDNVVASVKHYRDGVCKALLPLGDGPTTPYIWAPVVQLQVAKGRDGLWVLIEEDDDEGIRGHHEVQDMIADAARPRSK